MHRVGHTYIPAVDSRQWLKALHLNDQAVLLPKNVLPRAPLGALGSSISGRQLKARLTGKQAFPASENRNPQTRNKTQGRETSGGFGIIFCKLGQVPPVEG